METVWGTEVARTELFIKIGHAGQIVEHVGLAQCSFQMFHKTARSTDRVEWRKGKGN